MFTRKFFPRSDLVCVLKIQDMSFVVMQKSVVRGNLEGVCGRSRVLVGYLQTMNGTAVARIVVLRPIVSIKGPPAIPPNKADSGIRLPIHDF